MIIGQNVEIITASHNIHSEEWEQKNYGIVIEDYVCVATNVLILPSCSNIGYGAVCGDGAVLVKDVISMTVVSGNPAVIIGERKVVNKKLVVESYWEVILKHILMPIKGDNFNENSLKFKT